MQQLIDKYSRKISYLRVSVTDHCNYKCFYCRDEDSKGSLRQATLNNKELTRIVKIFTELGVHKIRLTGGEPLLRKRIVELVGNIGQIKAVTDFAMSTNGHLLESTAINLFKNGLHRLNISLDSLSHKRFFDITRGGDLDLVFKGISKAKAVGLNPIKINMVVMQDTNDDEIESMVDYATMNDLHLRFIETMPIGQPGIEATGKYYSAEKILNRVKQHLQQDLVPTASIQSDGPARNFKIGNASVGVITAISQHFCDTCNRVRLTAEGDLVLCLGQENSVSLRDYIRNGATDIEVKKVIINAIDKKPEKHFFTEDKFNVVNKQMVKMGG